MIAKMNEMLRVLILLWIVACIKTAAAQVPGCTDPLANNFDPAATVNDGSCTYNAASVSASHTFALHADLDETSGLIKWEDLLWTHNDDTDTRLFALDTNDGSIIQTFTIPGVVNIDWEEIAHDSAFVYIGDFGNNANGNRTNLRILRIEKQSLLMQSPLVDTIWFSYADQVDFSGTGANNTDFDCEAFIAAGDSLYLFTKQWVSNGTRIYSLSKFPGTHIACPQADIHVQGMVTGATHVPGKQCVILCGYSSLLQPFLYLLYDFHEFRFASGNKRKLGVSLAFHQVEGIATADGKKIYLSNEYFSNPPYITVPQKLHILDLTTYTGNYLNTVISGMSDVGRAPDFSVFPNPATDHIWVKTDSAMRGVRYDIYNVSGKKMLSGPLEGGMTRISIRKLGRGAHIISLGVRGALHFEVLKN